MGLRDTENADLLSEADDVPGQSEISIELEEHLDGMARRSRRRISERDNLTKSEGILHQEHRRSKKRFMVYIFLTFAGIWILGGLVGYSIGKGEEASVTERKLRTSSDRVILISLDGFRHDYLDQDITPNLTSIFVNNGFRAKKFRPSFPSSTFPNHWSIVTGLNPESHGVVANIFFDRASGKEFRVGNPCVNCSEYGYMSDYWYGGEPLWETAQRQGVVSVSVMWPGCGRAYRKEFDSSSSQLKFDIRSPKKYVDYNGTVTSLERVDMLMDLIDPAVSGDNVKFASLYMNLADTLGHDFGPLSNEVKSGVRDLDTAIGYLKERLMEKKLFSKSDIIVVSDHGMTAKKGVVPLSKYINLDDVDFVSYYPICNIYPKKERALEVLGDLTKQSIPHVQVFVKNKEYFENMMEEMSSNNLTLPDEVPQKYHYRKSERIGEIVLMADLGYFVVKDEDTKTSNGTHSFDNFLDDMQGIFLGAGPSFRKQSRLDTVSNLNIYNLVCRLLNVFPNTNEGTSYADNIGKAEGYRGLVEQEQVEQGVQTDETVRDEAGSGDTGVATDPIDSAGLYAYQHGKRGLPLSERVPLVERLHKEGHGGTAKLVKRVWDEGYYWIQQMKP
eukprot:Nk52_evm59s554 gene=Nk52_evmTU59s554